MKYEKISLECLEDAMKEWIPENVNAELKSINFGKDRDTLHEQENGMMAREITTTWMVGRHTRHIVFAWSDEQGEIVAAWCDELANEITKRNQTLVLYLNNAADPPASVGDVMTAFDIEPARLNEVEQLLASVKLDYNETLAKIHAGMGNNDYKRLNCHQVMKQGKKMLENLSRSPLNKFWEK